MWKFILKTLPMKMKGIYLKNAQFFPDLDLTIKNS